MRKLVLVAMGATFGLAAFGKSPLDCLDQDVLRGLLLQGFSNREVVIVADSPRELARFKVPRQLTWVGAGERKSQMAASGASGQISNVSAVYRSSVDPEAARTTAAAALVAGGWTLHSQDGPRSVEVFGEPIAYPSSDTYCHEGNPVSLTSSAVDGVTYVTLSVTRGLEGNTVGAMNACKEMPRMATGQRNALEKYLPRLQLPVDPATGKPTSARGMGRTGNDQKLTFNTTLVMKDSVANIAQHFAKQLAAQGWTSDGAFGLSGAIGSSWTKPAEAASVIRGTLVVSDFEQDRFSVMFRATRFN